jgi:hypothetical protein
MGTFENAAASANDGRELSINQLTAIDGIARKTAEAVYAIGIHSYADLAQYLSQHTAEQVSAALKEHGVNRPPGFIDQETWTRQAELFSQLENTAPTPPEGETEPEEEPKEAPPSPESREHDALFTVSFDVARDEDGEPVLHTMVCDEKNVGQKEVFQGSDTSPWVNWMLERANLPFVVEHIATQAEVAGEPPPTEATVPPTLAELYDAQLEISDVQLSVLGPTLDVPEKRLKAEINFRLSGPEAETLTSQGIPFRIEGYTVDLESGVLELVASDRSQLVPRVFEYRGQQKFGIPDAGRYEFHSVVLLLPPGKIMAYHRGPTMRVIP